MPHLPRPTVRCVLEDVADDLEDGAQRRDAQARRLPPLSVPLHTLSHPIVGFAAQRYSSAPPEPRDSIQSVRDQPWWKCRVSRWRGVVLYRNPDEQCWLCYVGFRREGDPEEAYAAFESSCKRGRNTVDSSHYLPTDGDLARLKAELLYEEKVEARQEFCAQVVEALLAAVGEPITQRELALSGAVVRIELRRAGDLGELWLSVEVDWKAPGAGDVLARVLDAVPGIAEDEWEAIPAVGSHASPLWIVFVDNEWVRRLQAAAAEYGTAALANDPTLAADDGGGVAHIVHRAQVMRAQIEGRMIRTACGKRIVPRNDWHGIPECEGCAATHAAVQQGIEAARLLGDE